MVYTITARNPGNGSAQYDVIEDFRPGAGITLNSATVNYGGEADGLQGTITSPLTGDGVAVSGERLQAGNSETFTITAVFDVDPNSLTTTGSDCVEDLGEIGNTGFANNVSGSPTDTNLADNDTCQPLDYDPGIQIDKVLAGSPTDLGNGSWQIAYTLIVSNIGTVDLIDIQVVDDLLAMVNRPNPNNGLVSDAQVSYIAGTVLTPNSGFTGVGNNNLLTGSDTFPVGAVTELELTFTFMPNDYFGPFDNLAVVEGTDLFGETVSDSDEEPFRLDVPSTPITLAWFNTSVRSGDSVLIEWETATEVANSGFYIYGLVSAPSEQDTSEEEWILLNEEIITSQNDSISAQRYSFTTEVLARAYLLVDVSTSGKELERGPFLLEREYGKPMNQKRINWDHINEESDKKKGERELRRKQKLKQKMDSLIGSSLDFAGRAFAAVLGILISPAQAEELLVFEVEEAGVYEVDYQMMLNAGLNLSGVEVDRIGLKEAGVLWPFIIENNGLPEFGPNSRIIFPARGIESIYALNNKYTLVIDEGQNLIQSDSRVIPSDAAFATSYQSEKAYHPQNFYTFLSPEDDDSWFADTLNAVSSPAIKNISMEVNDYAPSLGGGFGSPIRFQPTQNPELEVTVWGVSAFTGNGALLPDHTVEVLLGGQLIHTMRFDGVRSETARIPLPSISNGYNDITIKVPVSENYNYDLVRLDEVIVRYPRRFIAQSDQLIFSSDWSKFLVQGLSTDNALVIRLDEDGRGFLMTERELSSNEGVIYFAGSEIGVESSYFVSTENATKKPVISIAVSSAELETDAANYLVIAHPDFIGLPGQSLENFLLDLETKFGSSDLVDVEQVYAAMSGGVVDAVAIKDYIEYAYHNRGTRHVLLVGADNYDYHDNSQTGARSFIPSLYVPIANNVRAVPSDPSYALVDEDLIPDLSIARLPVRTSEDLLNLLAKRDAYLAKPSNEDILIAADEVDSSNYDFKASALQLADSYFSGLTVDTVFLDDTTQESATQKISESINSGTNFVNYFGHSATDRWAIQAIFTGDDAASLMNFGSPVVVAQWGCWNTFYAGPENESMADRLLLSGEQGAVTVMGATSFAKADASESMAGYLFENLRMGQSIGEAVLEAKREFGTLTPHQIDVLLGWTVLGFDDLPVFIN